MDFQKTLKQTAGIGAGNVGYPQLVLNIFKKFLGSLCESLKLGAENQVFLKI